MPFHNNPAAKKKKQAMGLSFEAATACRTGWIGYSTTSREPVAGVADVAGVAAVLLLAFLFFFTCFFAVVAGVVPFAGVGRPARQATNPAVASVKDSPSNTAEIFFMVFVQFLFEALVFCLCMLSTNHY